MNVRSPRDGLVHEERLLALGPWHATELRMPEFTACGVEYALLEQVSDSTPITCKECLKAKENK